METTFWYVYKTQGSHRERLVLQTASEHEAHERYKLTKRDFPEARTLLVKRVTTIIKEHDKTDSHQLGA